MDFVLFRRRRFDSGVGLSIFIRLLFYLTRMSVEEVDDANSQQPLSDAPHYVWQYFTIMNHTDPKKSGAKNAICAFCDKSFSGCSTTRAAAHILGRPVLGQIKAGIHPCIVINKKDDDSRDVVQPPVFVTAALKRK